MEGSKVRALKRISDYIPDHEEETRLVQAKVEVGLFEQFNIIRKANNISWKDFIVASMKKFIDEKKGK